MNRSGAGERNWYETVVPRDPPGLVRKATLLGGAAAAVAIVNWYAPSSVPISVRLPASLIIAAAAIPTWLWAAGADRATPFFALFALAFAAMYALPVFIVEQLRASSLDRHGLPSEVVAPALWVALLGLGAVMVGYYGVHNRWLRGVVPRVQFKWEADARLKFWGFMFAIGGLAAYYFRRESPVSAELSQLANYAGELCAIGIAILYLLQLDARLGVLGKGVLWGFLVPGRFLVGVLSGATASGFSFLVTLLMLRTMVRHKIPWVLLVLGVGVVFYVRALQVPYRAATWSGPLRGASVTERAKYFAELTTLLQRDPRLLDFSVRFGANRVAAIAPLAVVVRATPDHVPYWMGETYLPLLYKPIPRLLYEDKPEELTGRTFPHRYGLMQMANPNTVYNLPQLVELYANFGLLGVGIGMFLIGTLYRLLNEMFIHPGAGFGAVLGSAYALAMLINTESAASHLFGGLMWTLVFLALVNAFLHFDRVVSEWRLPARAAT